MTPVEEIRRAAHLMREHGETQFTFAVADWLDYVAKAWPDAPHGHALLVARAYLGGAT